MLLIRWKTIKKNIGSDVYGTVAYILNIVRIYSIPLCFLGIAIGAIHQYVIGVRKLDTLEKVAEVKEELNAACEIF